MTALEAIAAAAYADWVEPVKCAEPAWEDLPQSHRDRLMSAMRAGLLQMTERSKEDTFRAQIYFITEEFEAARMRAGEER